MAHLAKRSVLPNQVVALGKKNGEGLEAWGRASRRLPAETKILDGSSPKACPSKSKTATRPCEAGVRTIAAGATKIMIDLRQSGPLYCLEKGDKQTVWALVPPIKLGDTDPVTNPKRTRRLLAAGLEGYAASSG